MRITTIGRVAASAIGAAALIASLVAFPASADAAAATTVRGTVTVSGHAVADVPVGTWSPTRGVLATARTDADGRFVLHSPAGSSVVAYAGSKPSASTAVSAVGSAHLVRGVIGATAPRGLAAPLQQRVTRAVPSRLGGGHALRFRLQEAGRFTASSPVLGRFEDVTGEIDVLHGGYWFGTRFTADQAGTVTSGWLVPGRYDLLWNGNAPTERTWVTVRAGTTVTAPPPAFGPPAAGATVTIRVTSGGAAVPEGVPAVRLVAGGTVRAPSTDASGAIVETGLAPGTYRFEVGRNFDDPDEGFDGPPFSQDYLPGIATVVVRKGATTADATVSLEPASKITGTATGADVEIAVESTEGVVVADTVPDQRTHGFTAGGLTSGRYMVFAIDAATHTTDVLTLDVPAASSTASAPTALSRALAPSKREPTIHGTVEGATSGYVTFRSPAVHGATLYSVFASISKHGTYSVRSIPALLRPQVQVDHRVDRSAALRSVTGSATIDLVPGAKLASVAARFTVDSHVVHVDVEARGPGGLALELAHAGAGRSTAHDVVPGRYAWSRISSTLPATDGPWYYTAPKGSFTVHAGSVAHLGTTAITIRG